MPELVTGDVVWANLDPTSGREQGGRRPVVVVASALYLDVADTLAIVVPVTTRDRGWPNHIRLAGPTGLDQPSWALTEQPRTISRTRLDAAAAGNIDDACLDEIRLYLRDFLGF
jgi:mRNA interferase MazF